VSWNIPAKVKEMDCKEMEQRKQKFERMNKVILTILDYCRDREERTICVENNSEISFLV
jgi:hypothetical protein